nr:uncharacterized protein LOC113809578 [Penaeus vannamei]
MQRRVEVGYPGRPRGVSVVDAATDFPQEVAGDVGVLGAQGDLRPADVAEVGLRGRGRRGGGGEVPGLAAARVRGGGRVRGRVRGGRGVSVGLGWAGGFCGFSCGRGGRFRPAGSPRGWLLGGRAAGGGASTSISRRHRRSNLFPFSSLPRFLDSFGLCDLDDEGVSALEEASTFRRWSRKALELHSRSWHSSRLILRPPNSEWRKEILWVFLKELRVVLTEVVWVPLLAWHAGQRVPPLRTRLDLAESSARDPSSDTISTLRASGVPEPRSRKRKGCFVRRQRSSCKDRGRGRPRSCWGGVTLALPPSEP